MEFFFVLTISFLKEGRVYTHTYPDTVWAEPGSTAESLYWRTYEMAQKKYDFHSVADVLHWSIMPNVLPGVPAKCGLCKRPARPDTGYCDGHSR